MPNNDLINPSLFLTVFKAENPLDVLRNENIIFACYQNISLEMHGKIPYDASNYIKRDLIENYILYLAQKIFKSKQEKELLDKYKTMYKTIFSSFGYDYLVGTKIYKYYESILSSDEIKKNHHRIFQISGQALDYFNRFKNKEELTDYELNYMFEYFSNMADSMDPLAKAMMKALAKWLLITYKDYGIHAKKFLITYLAQKFCLDNGYLEIPIYITNKNLEGTPHLNFGRTRTPHCIITMQYDLVNGNPNDSIESKFTVSRIMKILHTLYHELQHIKQYRELQKNTELTLSTFNAIKHRIMKKYLSTKEEDEYLLNYEDRETERDANINGWISTYQTLNHLAPSRLEEIDKAKINATITAYEQSVALQTNMESRQRVEIELYNVRKLTSIISKNPKIVRDYPALKLFYKKNGRRKRLSEIITLYHELETKGTRFEGYKVDLSIFDEFIKTMIIDDGIGSFPLNQEPELLTTWYSIIYKLYQNEYNSMQQMYAIKDEVYADVVKHFCESRISYMQMYKKYLERNYNQIVELKQSSYNNERFDELDIEQIENMFYGCLVLVAELSESKGVTYGIRPNI